MRVLTSANRSVRRRGCHHRLELCACGGGFTHSLKMLAIAYKRRAAGSRYCRRPRSETNRRVSRPLPSHNFGVSTSSPSGSSRRSSRKRSNAGRPFTPIWRSSPSAATARRPTPAFCPEDTPPAAAEFECSASLTPARAPLSVPGSFRTLRHGALGLWPPLDGILRVQYCTNWPQGGRLSRHPAQFVSGPTSSWFSLYRRRAVVWLAHLQAANGAGVDPCLKRLPCQHSHRKNG